MSRSLKKGAFFHYSLIRKTKNKKDFRVIQLWSRSSTIIPEFIGQNFSVHNGKSFISITVTEDMIGHKFGEFALTRKQVKHKQKKIKR